jgi:hypothetical protein
MDDHPPRDRPEAWPVGKNLVYVTKRYPGRHSHERPGGRIMLTIIGGTMVAIAVGFLIVVPDPLGHVWYLIGWVAMGTLAIYWKARNVMAHKLVGSMVRRWGEGYYIYELPPDWPVRELLASIVLRLKKRGFRVHRVQVPREIDVPELGFEQVVDAFRVEPGGKAIYVLDTRSWNPMIKTGGMLSSWGPAQRVNAFLIRPVETDIFTEEHDLPVKVTGNVLWDHDVDRVRSGHPTSIPKEYWE